MRVVPFGLWVLVLSMTACVDPDVGRDRDGDGFRTAELDGDDCDDANPNINPAASEACGNGVDDNCDGIIDDVGVGQIDWYVDNDEDGFPADTIFQGCSPPSGTFADVTQGVDCDDNNDTINPGAAEVYYDGIDQDCAGGDDNDADGDGHSAVTEGGDDCDDADALVNPSAPEVCNNGVDDDCDGGPGPCEYRGDVDIDEVGEFFLPHGVYDAQWVDVTGDDVLDLVTSPSEEPFVVRIYDGATLGNGVAPIAVTEARSSGGFLNLTGDFDGNGLNDIVYWSTGFVQVYLMPPVDGQTLQSTQTITYREVGAPRDGLGFRHVAVVGRPTFNSDDSLAVFGSFPGATNDPGVWMVSASTGVVNLAQRSAAPSQDVIGGVAFIPGDGTAVPMAIGTSLFTMTGIHRVWNVLGQSPPAILGTGLTEPVGIGMAGLPQVQHVNWGGERMDIFSSGFVWAPSDSDIPAGVGVPLTGVLTSVRMPYLLGVPDVGAGEVSDAIRGRKYCDVNLDGTADILQTRAVAGQAGGGGIVFSDNRADVYYDGANFSEFEEVDADAHFISADQAGWTVQSCSSDGQPIVLSSPDRAISVGVPRRGL